MYCLGQRVKPYLDFPDQLLHAQREYGLPINVPQMCAERFFASHSMYDLINGYQEKILDSSGKIAEGCSLFYLVTLYQVDRSVQATLFKYSVLAENRFKNILAHVIAKNFGEHEDQYLERKHYISTPEVDRIKLLSKINNFIAKTRDKIDEELKDKGASLTDISRDVRSSQPTWYYLCEYQHIPPWILLRNTSFANTIHLYSILKQAQKKEVVSQILNTSNPGQEDFEIVKISLEIVRQFRNSIAHNLKFINYRAKEYKFTKTHLNHMALTKKYNILPNPFSNGKGQNDIYGFLGGLITLIDDPFTTYYLFSELETSQSLFKIPNSGNNTRTIIADYNQYLGLEPDFEQRIQAATQRSNEEYKKLITSP